MSMIEYAQARATAKWQSLPGNPSGLGFFLAGGQIQFCTITGYRGGLTAVAAMNARLQHTAKAMGLATK